MSDGVRIPSSLLLESQREPPSSRIRTAPWASSLSPLPLSLPPFHYIGRFRQKILTPARRKLGPVSPGFSPLLCEMGGVGRALLAGMRHASVKPSRAAYTVRGTDRRAPDDHRRYQGVSYPAGVLGLSLSTGGTSPLNQDVPISWVGSQDLRLPGVPLQI